MPKAIKYAIFKTNWGYFGLAGTKYGLLRTCLPAAEREKAKFRLLTNLQAAQYDKNFFKTTQEQIIAYFEGAYVSFSSDIHVILACPERGRGNGFSRFAISVLTVCRDIRFGQTISYAGLANKLGRPVAASPVRNSTKERKPKKGKISNGARAVGGALAKNPLPLIIPCHRVIRSDGQPGGFSAPGGGKKLKEKLLKHEYQTLMESKND